MAETQRITKLSPGEATIEAAQSLAAAGIVGASVTSSGANLGRQGKVYLHTLASGLADSDAALAVLRDLPGVCAAGTMGRSTAYIYRRLI
jgi:hypothetical protein